MAALTEETRNECHRIFDLCEYFNAPTSLCTLFGSLELTPFRNRLPEVDNKEDRIWQTIDYLVPKQLEGGHSVFALFIAALCDRYDPPDGRKQALVHLHAKVKQELERADPDPDQQPDVYILVPKKMSLPPFQGIAKEIEEAVQAAHCTPYIDGPHGANNIDRINKSEAVLVYVVSTDPEIMFSAALAIAFAKRVLLLANEDDNHFRLEALLSGAMLIPYEPDKKEVLKRRIKAGLTGANTNQALFQKALPPKLQIALNDPTRLDAPTVVVNTVVAELRDEKKEQDADLATLSKQLTALQAQLASLSQPTVIDTTLPEAVEAVLAELRGEKQARSASFATLNQKLEQLQERLVRLGQPTVIDTTLQQVNDLRTRLSDMITKHSEAEQRVGKAEDYLARLARDRDAVVRQMLTVARTLETDRALLTSPRDAAALLFVPAALLVPGPPRATAAERQQAERFVKAFYLDALPVTNAQFARFVAATDYQTVVEREHAAEGRDGLTWRSPDALGRSLDERMDHPVVWVYHKDALAYAAWAERRLPTRLEWERAMRGVDGQPWPWGEVFDPTRCNLNTHGTTPVTAYPDGVSPTGCRDLVGNVWEWLADALPDGRLALMGGSWAEQTLKLGYKQIIVPGDGADDAMGFRCAMDVPEGSGGGG